MQRHELDRTLTRMLDAHGPVSDLNFTVGRPPQVEHHGELVPVVTDPPQTTRCSAVVVRHRVPGTILIS